MGAEVSPVEQARQIGEAIIRWCDDDTASPTVLGSIAAGLNELCRNWPTVPLWEK